MWLQKKLRHLAQGQRTVRKGIEDFLSAFGLSSDSGSSYADCFKKVSSQIASLGYVGPQVRSLACHQISPRAWASSLKTLQSIKPVYHSPVTSAPASLHTSHACTSRSFIGLEGAPVKYVDLHWKVQPA